MSESSALMPSLVSAFSTIVDMALMTLMYHFMKGTLGFETVEALIIAACYVLFFSLNHARIEAKARSERVRVEVTHLD